jgi:glucokinase
MGRGTITAFVALGLSVVILANDFTALNVSLPAMEQDFDTDVSTIQRVINAYALVFGVPIVTGGDGGATRRGDRLMLGARAPAQPTSLRPTP